MKNEDVDIEILKEFQKRGTNIVTYLKIHVTDKYIHYDYEYNYNIHHRRYSYIEVEKYLTLARKYKIKKLKNVD
jgi:hypothetical protein